MRKKIELVLTRKPIPRQHCRAVLFIITTWAIILASCTTSAHDNVQPTATISSTRTLAPSFTMTEKPSETPSMTPSKTPSPTEAPSPTITLVPWVYVFPVQPYNRSVSYQEGTSAHGYPATDIFAPTGWRYVAVTDGTIEFLSTTDQWDEKVDDPNTRGGISVSLIGDDGIRYYGSHLSGIAKNISTGLHVSAGEVLGYIGETGNARGRGSHLHFGISRPSYPEDWKTRRGEIDPFPYLNAWAAGLNIMPKYATATPKPTP